MHRQVPTDYYFIIGRGRLARHFCRYFELKNIPFLQWSRVDSAEDLKKFLPVSKLALLAISDDSIEGFAQENSLSPEKTVHFSGALSTPCALQLHPLMTFSKDLYDLQTYESFCFVSPHGTPALANLIPELSNKHFFIPQGSEALYHALCVLSGNGTTLLWQTVLEQFKTQFSLPQEALSPYLEQTVFNLQKNSATALTGPWARNDQSTILKNTNALQNTPLATLYKSLSDLYKKQQTPPLSQRSLQ